MNIEKFSPPTEGFEEHGGEILERSDNDTPTKWICGVTPEGTLIHPPEIIIDPQDDLYVGIEPHPTNPNKNCWVASLEEPSDLKDWAYN